MTQKPNSTHTVVATIKHTGEVIEYSFTNQQELAEAYRDATSRLDAYRTIKNIMLDTSMQLIIRSAEKEKSSKDVKKQSDLN